ncbi:MAG TPA: AAA family ATPase, partial [Candidatus Polarisedimenticolia bacterium]|nr:AAA family ATPase [Candidatus Polarisedimenticolia bacterium]
MRLRSISLRGATRFIGAEPVRIDFDSLGEGLIALVGTNGAGKTTLLEATPAALHKSFPSRPSWYENFTGRDSFLEATFDDDGHELKVRLAVDAERRQTESYIFRDGVSLTTGRSAEFDAEIERRFGSRELLLASVFASQGKEGNFLLLKKADRKSLFVELLGLGVLEVLHESAKDRSGAAEHELDVARVAVTGVEAEVADLLVRQMELGEAESAADRAAGALTTARTEEAAALAALERARSAGERLKALEDAEAAAAREVKAADRLIDEAIDAEDKATDRYEERLRFLENGKVEELEPRALTRHTGAMERLQARRVTLEAALQNIPDVARARAELDAFELDLVGLDEADQETAQAKLSHERAVLDLKAAESKLVAATKARTDEIARLKRSAGLLPQVPCTARPQWGMEVDAPDLEGCIEDFIDLAGTCPLLSDARSAQARILILEADPSEGEEAAEKARREAAEKVTAAADERT